MVSSHAFASRPSSTFRTAARLCWYGFWSRKGWVPLSIRSMRSGTTWLLPSAADERLDAVVELPPGVRLVGPAEQVEQHHRGAEFARGRELSGAVVPAGDPQVGSPAPHHRLEVLSEFGVRLVVAARLELAEVHFPRAAE